jgi:hypothetical protein
LNLDSTLLSAILLLVGGFLGVLLGGFLDRRRARWQWKMDARQRAYLGLLRAIEDLQRAGGGYWVALVSAGVSDSEVASSRSELDRRADQLLIAVREVRIVGSPEMVKRADDAGRVGWEVKAAQVDEEFPERWSPKGQKHGFQQTLLVLAEVVEFLAREELLLLSWRERRAARKAKQRKNP